MKFDKLVKQILNEAIPLYIAKKAFGRKHSSNYKDEMLNKVFGNKDRIIIPYDNKSKKLEMFYKIKNSYTYKEIVKFLKENGYLTGVDNYIQGKAFKKNDKNIYNIGKILQQFNNQRLLEYFKTDVNRQASGEYVIVISRHPYDLAGASTDRNWTSCIDNNYVPIVYKDKKNKQNQNRYYTDKSRDKNYFEQDKSRYEREKFGNQGLIAYLVDKKEVMPNGKIELRKPISRILLAEYEDDNATDEDYDNNNVKIMGYYVSEEGCYGVEDKIFKDQVEGWLSKNNLLPKEFEFEDDEPEELEDI